MTKDDPENQNPSGKRIFKEHLQQGLAIGWKQRFRHRSPGRENYDIQHIEGDDLHKSTGKWNWLGDRSCQRPVPETHHRWGDRRDHS